MAAHEDVDPRSAFISQAFDDPYLSGYSDLEEFGIEPQLHTPSVSSIDPRSRLSSLSPADQQLLNDASLRTFDFDDASFDNFGLLDLNGQAPTEPFSLDDMISVDVGQTPALANAETVVHVKGENQEVADQISTQTLSDASGSSHPSANGTEKPLLQPPRLIIPDFPSSNESTQGHNRSKSAPALSPIVRISQVHRGDSPTRDNDEWTSRNNKRSSAHLSPTGGSSDESDGQNEMTGNGARSFSPSRAEDGSWIPDASTGQAGVDPYARNDEYGPSPKDIEEQRQLDDKNADIQVWSASVSVANSEAGESSPCQLPRGRTRAVSAVELRHDYFNLMQPHDSHIPGPGRFGHEPDRENDFDTASNISHADSRDRLPHITYTPEEERLAQQLNRSYPWKDEPRFSFPLAIETQPGSSSLAMQQYEKMAREMDEVSRVGTWGSRRLNDAEVDSLLKSDSFFKNLSLSTAAIRRLLPRKSSSSLKDKKRHSQQSNFEPESFNTSQKKESGLAARLSRRPSLNRPKSPTSIMAAAIAGTMAASIGSHNSLSARSPVSPGVGTLSPIVPWNNRSRSKSEGSVQKPSLIQTQIIPNSERRLGVQQGASALMNHRESEGLDADEDDDDDLSDDGDISLDLGTSSQPILPTLEGFKRQISLLSPQLEPVLNQRFATAQLQRYKKLIDDQSKHAELVQCGRCDAKERCFASGGSAKLLPPRPNAKDPSATYCQFQIPGHENSGDEDECDVGEKNKSVETTIMLATFADGIRLPPVKRLPAEFECSLCFKVKKFQKPSDWTKHIYEDITPFTCTISDCLEQKSFKRKADWVRHENERHRHLEWWACNESNCDHKCYRKNNFVQHLVREHRKPDPTAKKTKGSAAGLNNSARGREIAKLWEQVEQCHKKTQKKPEEAPCPFCHNTCNDWRKLMVHLARHMERIALPVLRLAEEQTSSTNRASNMYENKATPAPSISVYGSGESNEIPDTNVVNGLGGTNMSEAIISSPMQSMIQPGPHVLSHTMNTDISPFGTTYPPASPSSFLQAHYTPVHRNSMSYPPAPNANEMAFRQRDTIPTLGLESEEQLFQSPQDTYFNPDDYIPASNTSASISGCYTSAPTLNYTIATSGEMVPNNMMSANNNGAYMPRTAAQMQDNGHTYPPVTYRFQ